MRIDTSGNKSFRSLCRNGVYKTRKLCNHLQLRIHSKVTRRHLFFTGGNLPFNADENRENDLKNGCQIAVQIHCFYTDLLNEVSGRLDSIPYPYDLYISTDTEEKKAEIQSFFIKNSGKARNIQVQVFPNKGRDILPLLLQMKPVFHQYSYFLHIHTKKTLTSSIGDIWRFYLYQNLLGSEDVIREIFFMFEKDKKLGILFPDFPPFIPEDNNAWIGNKALAKKIFQRWGLKSALPTIPVFPAGDMFWGRTEALRQVFDYAYSENDFPEELGQRDGTLMHAIERLWVYVARENGFDYCLVRNNEDIQS